ncbi:MAG: diguanylate cyclase [Desulfonatronovibrionaceae bacterium]
MKEKNTTPKILFLETDPDIREKISDCIDNAETVKTLNPGLSSLKEEVSFNRPHILITPVAKWAGLSWQEQKVVDENEVQLALVAENGDKLPPDLNIPSSFLGFVRLPIQKNEITGLLAKASQAFELYSDIYHMAKEIALERELLARKSTQLSFINRILTRAAQTLNIKDIMALADEEFKNLLQARCTMGIFWDASGEPMEAGLFIPSFFEPEEEREWTSHLLEAAGKLTGKEVREYQTGYYTQDSIRLEYPQPGKTIVIPIRSGQDTLGLILLVTDDETELGKDQVEIVRNAGNHLGLAALNALKYERVRIRADHDGLTKIYNRHHFDNRLKEEIKRHQRHGSTLSLLMLDVDYFKNINDKYGHQAGDLALKKIGEILQYTLRETDFPARYGGEEFAIILPETSENQAWFLAHRLRKKIAGLTLQYGRHTIRLTVSIGITSMEPGSLYPAGRLIEHADRALYLAKNSGRNMVCTSKAPAWSP